jgi:hypothetical protein
VGQLLRLNATPGRERSGPVASGGATNHAPGVERRDDARGRVRLIPCMASGLVPAWGHCLSARKPPREGWRVERSIRRAKARLVLAALSLSRGRVVSTGSTA